jgi:hypothetical protein
MRHLPFLPVHLPPPSSATFKLQTPANEEENDVCTDLGGNNFYLLGLLQSTPSGISSVPANERGSKAVPAPICGRGVESAWARKWRERRRREVDVRRTSS